MKHPEPRLLPRHDYDRALKNAVSWLGDRYLLAEPVRRRNPESTGFFAEPPRWHQATRRTLAQRVVR